MSELKMLNNTSKVEETNEIDLRLSDLFCMSILEKKHASKAAKELVGVGWPIIKNLQLNKLSPPEQVKELAAIIVEECCIKKISLYLFCKGAWRPSANQPVSYHSHYAPMVWKEIAEMHNLPKVKSYSMKYILSDNNFINAVQPLYRMLRALNFNRTHNPVYIDKIIDDFIKDRPDGEYIDLLIDRRHIKDLNKCRFITVESTEIHDWRFEPNLSVVVMCGKYELCGVRGHLIDTDGERFDHTFTIAPTQTKTNGYNDSESPFAKNPNMFLRTKFMRHVTELYYKSKTSFVINTLDPEEVDSMPLDMDSPAIQDRIAVLTQRVRDLPKVEKYTSVEDQWMVQDGDELDDNEGTN